MNKRRTLSYFIVFMLWLLPGISLAAETGGVISWRHNIEQETTTSISKEMTITPLFATPEERLQGLTYLNQLRVATGLIELSSNSLLDQTANNHTVYLVTNNLFSHYEDATNFPVGFTGQTPTDRGEYVGYKSSVSENLSAGDTTIEESIDSLFSAIYHRFGFLSFNYDEIGIGVERSPSYAYQSVFGYNLGTSQINALCSGTTYTGDGGYYYGVCNDDTFRIETSQYLEARDTNSQANPLYVLWPYADQSDSVPFFYEESPDPLPNCSVSGYPVSVQFNGRRAGSISMSSFKLYDSGDNEVTDTIILTDDTDPNNRFSNREFALFPKQRLDWGSKYTAEFLYTENDEPKTLSWSYTTKEVQYPYYITTNGGSYDVVSGVIYGFYLPPTNCNDTIISYSFSYASGLSIEQSGFIDSNTLFFQVAGDNGLSMQITAHKAGGGSTVFNTTIEDHGDAILRGDINGNGVHDLADVIIGLQISSGNTPTGINPNSDINYDGRINLLESLHNLRKMQSN